MFGDLRTWIERTNLAEKTGESHVDNINFLLNISFTMECKKDSMRLINALHADSFQFFQMRCYNLISPRFIAIAKLHSYNSPIDQRVLRAYPKTLIRPLN